MAIILIVNQMFKIRMIEWGNDIKQYSFKDLTSLYAKSFFVVFCSLSLALFYWYNNHLSPQGLYMDLIFYSLDGVLTLFALDSIIKGEKLRYTEFKNIEAENKLLKSKLNPHFL